MEYKIGKELESILYKIESCIGYDYEEKSATEESMKKTLEDVRYEIKQLINNN